MLGINVMKSSVRWTTNICKLVLKTNQFNVNCQAIARDVSSSSLSVTASKNIVCSKFFLRTLTRCYKKYICNTSISLKLYSSESWNVRQIRKNLEATYLWFLKYCENVGQPIIKISFFFVFSTSSLTGSGVEEDTQFCFFPFGKPQSLNVGVLFLRRYLSIFLWECLWLCVFRFFQSMPCVVLYYRTFSPDGQAIVLAVFKFN